jgi:hypothetical protein
MITFTTKQKDLIDREISSEINIIQTEDVNIIQQCIDIFNSEIKWNDMFDLNRAIDRIKNGNKMFVGFYKNELFGYCWLESISLNTYSIFNVFSKKEPVIRNYGATDLLYYVIKNHTHGNIIASVDEWNTKSINVFNKLGFSEI